LRHHGECPEQDYKQFSNIIVNKNWITEIWKHLHSVKATVVMQQKWKPGLGHTNDIAIMDCIKASNQFSCGELQDINRCQIYLDSFFLSDITNIKGMSIEPWATSAKCTTMRTTTWAWPMKQRPSVWKVWNKVLEILVPEQQVSPAIGT
jgi:hypothetical protein